MRWRSGQTVFDMVKLLSTGWGATAPPHAVALHEGTILTGAHVDPKADRCDARSALNNM
jgi:hypothetical protein